MVFTRPSYGRSLPGRCSCRPEPWDIALGTLSTSSGVLPGTCSSLPGGSWYVSDAGAVVGGPTRHVAHLVNRVSVHGQTVTQSYAVRCLMRPRCGRWHSTRCPRRTGCCQAHPVVLPVGLGTPPVPSRLLPAPVLHRLFSSARRASAVQACNRQLARLRSRSPGPAWFPDNSLTLRPSGNLAASERSQAASRPIAASAPLFPRLEPVPARSSVRGIEARDQPS